MDIGLHQLADRRIHEPVTRERREAPEGLGDYTHPEMAQAPCGAGVARMVAAVILDDELLGRETLPQNLPEPGRPRLAVQGSTARKGSTSMRSNTPALT
jgi:hypothetical protein